MPAGENHPQTGMCFFTQAEILKLRGKYDDAKLLYSKALVIFIQSYGHNHYDVYRVLLAAADNIRMPGTYAVSNLS
jgi:hypothetical protein